MNTVKRASSYLALGVAALLAAACTSQMEPAKKALDGAESAVADVSADAGKYLPDQLASLQRKVDDLKASYKMKDYKSVLGNAPAIVAEAGNLAVSAARKKEEAIQAASSEWSTLDATLPQQVAAVNARVEALSRSRRLPKDVDLSAAKANLSDAKALWDKAQAAFKSGDVAGAVTSAREVERRTEAAATALKLQLPAGGTS